MFGGVNNGEDYLDSFFSAAYFNHSSSNGLGIKVVNENMKNENSIHTKRPSSAYTKLSKIEIPERKGTNRPHSATRPQSALKRNVLPPVAINNSEQKVTKKRRKTKLKKVKKVKALSSPVNNVLTQIGNTNIYIIMSLFYIMLSSLNRLTGIRENFVTKKERQIN